MAHFATYLLCILLIIAITLTIFLLIYYTGSTQIWETSSSTIENPLTPAAYWGPVSPSQDQTRSACLLYTYSPVPQGKQFASPLPTLDPAILNSLIGEVSSESCFYEDQLFAEQVTHTCLGDPNSLGCLGVNGERIPVGKSETFYMTCGEAKLCPSRLGYLALDFSSNSCNLPTPSCLTRNGTSIYFSPCLNTSIGQQLTFIQSTPSSYPSPVTGGSIIKFQSRETGECLGISDGVVKFGECKTNSGFNWWLVPPLVTNGQPSLSQIVYVGNLPNLSILPTDSAKIADFIRSQGLYSLSLSNSSWLAPYSFDAASQYGKDSAAQIIEQSLFIPIFSSPSCPCPGCFPWSRK